MKTLILCNCIDTIDSSNCHYNPSFIKFRYRSNNYSLVSLTIYKGLYLILQQFLVTCRYA